MIVGYPIWFIGAKTGGISDEAILTPLWFVSTLVLPPPILASSSSASSRLLLAKKVVCSPDSKNPFVSIPLVRNEFIVKSRSLLSVMMRSRVANIASSVLL